MRPVARLFLIPFLLIVVLGMMVPVAIEAQEGSGEPSEPETESLSEPPENEEEITEENTVREASPYLLDLKMGDSGLDLRWDGYWRMSFVAGGGFGRLSQESVYTDLSRGTSFFQEPDVTLTLWMFNKWFIETTFLEGFDRNTYRAGYVGDPGEFVREVVIGNAGVNATSYAEIDVPAPTYNTPGIAGKFGTDRSDHEILIRYDPTETQDKTFQGQYEVNTQDIGLPDFIEGKYFILPDTNVSGIQIFLEDRLGSISGTDGLGVTRYYRQAEAVEYYVDNETGLVVLDEEHDGQVLVYYLESTTFPVGTTTVSDFIITPNANLHPDLGAPITYENFDFNTATDPYDPEGRDFNITSLVTLPVGDALILYNPAKFSPFERQNIYYSDRPLPEETWRIVPLVRDRGSLYPSTATEYGFIPDTVDKTVSVFGNATGGLRDPENRYPFAGSDPEVYGPGRETDMDKLSRILVLAIREPNSGYSLGTGVVPGSVIVRVNGVRDKTVEIGNDGSITFSRYIYLDDWIEVDYRTETLDMDGGDLFIYQGNHFSLAPRLNLELAESVRWNLSQNRTTEEFEQSPGVIKVASTLDWEADNAAIRLTGDAALTTPDTSGNLRLFGMEGGRLGLVFLTDTLVGPPPDPTDSSVFPNPPGGNRGDADQYDYITTGVFGSETLNNYLWTGATSSGEDAPGLAASINGDSFDGRVMDLRFNLPDASTLDWTSGEFLADYSGPIDISGYSAIEFPIMFLDDFGSLGLGSAPAVTLQIGEIGESEDHHEDGVVDGYDLGSMVEWDISADVLNAWNNPGTTETVSITLSPSERAKLASVRSFRIIIEKTGEASGRFIMGAPEFAGSSFRTEVRNNDDTLADDQTIISDEVDNSTSAALMNKYSEVATVFHPDDEDNESLRVRWGTGIPGEAALTGGDRWEAVAWFDAVPLEAYRSLVFYVNNTIGTGDMTATASDADGKGVSVTWNVPDNTEGWDRISVNIADGTAVSASGRTFSNVTIDNDAGDISRFVLTFEDAGTVPSGELYLDEIHFRDPAFAITGGTELQAYWRYEDDVASIGNFPVLGDITVDGRSQLAGGTVLSGLERSNTAVTGSVNVSADILGITLNTDWRTTWNGGDADWSGSHNLRIPARSSVFWVDESYARGVSGGEDTFSRGNGLNLALRPGNIHVFADALYDGQSLIQGWGGETGWKGKSWNTDLEISYILNTLDTPESSGDYFTSWIQDYSYLIPSDAEVTNREAHHTLNLGLDFGFIGFSWDPQLRMKVARSPAWNQENRWAGTLSMPLRFKTWNITTSYRRDLKQVVDPGASNTGYGEAWGVFTDSLRGQFPLTSYLPFRELMGQKDGEYFASATEGMAEVDYETELSLDFRRTAGSRVLDLFLPSSGEFSMERDYQRKGDTVGWDNEWRSSVGFTAINLFGRFGRYPFLNFYNSEEISSLIQFTMTDYNGLYFPTPDELMLQTNWAFTGNRNRRFVVDYRLNLDWDPEERTTVNDGRLEYQWRTASRDRLHIPVFKRVIPRQHHLESKERLSILWSHPWSDAAPEHTEDYGFLIYHETSWVFEDAGHLKGWLALGLGETDEIFTNGWEIGLEAEFRF